MFAKRLREGVRSGEITVVDSLMEIGLSDVTPALARRSGFMCVVDFLKVAKHGAGERVFFVEFHYVAET